MKDVSWLRRPQFTFTQCRLTIRHEDDHDEIGDDDDDCDGDDDVDDCDGDDAASPSGMRMSMMRFVMMMMIVMVLMPPHHQA